MPRRSNSSSAITSSKSSRNRSFPSPRLIAISQREAMLTTMSLSGSLSCPLTWPGIRRDPSRHHKKAFVSRRSLTTALEQLRDFLVRELKVGRNPDLTFAAPGHAPLALFRYRHELHKRLAVARDDDLLASEGALDKARKRGFGLVHIDDLCHCGHLS